MLSMADFPHVSDERLRSVVAHWLEIRADRLLPSRRDIDPARIRAALSHIWLCDYEPQDERFCYRLAGEEVNALYGMTLVGRDLADTLPSDTAAEVLSRYRRMRHEPMAIHMTGKIHLTDGRALDGESRAAARRRRQADGYALGRRRLRLESKRGGRLSAGGPGAHDDSTGRTDGSGQWLKIHALHVICG